MIRTPRLDANIRARDAVAVGARRVGERKSVENPISGLTCFIE